MRLWLCVALGTLVLGWAALVEHGPLTGDDGFGIHVHTTASQRGFVHLNMGCNTAGWDPDTLKPLWNTKTDAVEV